MEKDLQGRVQSVDRALSLLEILGGDSDGMRLTELARGTRLSVSTVHRLLTTLEQRQFVQFSAKDNRWHIGRQSYQVGSAFVRDRHFVATALPFLRKLRDLTHETANLGIVDCGAIVLVNQVESREINKAASKVGGRTPMTASGMGKAILSCYSDDEVSAVVDQFGMRRMTAKTIHQRTTLDEQLQTARINGYTLDDEEYLPGLRCLAAPVYDHQDEIVCAISVSGQNNRISDDRLPLLGRLVAYTAGELTRALGGRAM